MKISVNQKINGFILLILVVVLLGMAGVANSAPTITSWSSTGGTTTNKDNAQDIMYLINQGDGLSFSVTVDQNVGYEWTVNKTVLRTVTTPVTSDTFNWTVPNEKGIYEIHLRCWNSANEETHKEWVVATLNSSEAPALFDYFTDLRCTGRTEKDPWNRALIEWQYDPRFPVPTVIEASKGFVRSNSDGQNYWIRAGMSIPYGTWKFRYRVPEGNTGAWGWRVEYMQTPELSRACYYGKESDTHHHCVVYVRPECTFSYDYDGTGWPEDGKWHEVTMIRTPDTWLHVYNDYIYEFSVQDKLNVTPSTIALFPGRYAGHEAYIDNVEVYREKYLFPKTEVSYGQYTWNYYYNPSDGRFYPETRNGIVVKGRNVRLSDIANLLGDPSKFTYNTLTKTAVSSADLVIHDGSELLMDNETLKFNNNFDGERHFVLKYGAELKIESSTITTTNNYYFVWNNAGSTTHFGRSDMPQRIDPVEFQKVGFSGAVWPLGNAGVIRFTANNSTIDNTAHIFWDSPMELDITNTKFTNLQELDIGDYTGVATTGQQRSRQRWFPKGDKSFWVYMDEVNTNKFNLNNITFKGKTSPVNITFMINALRDKLNVYNLNLENENIVIKKSLPQQAGQSHTWIPYTEASYESASYGGKGTGMNSKLGLVNSKFKNLVIATDYEPSLAWGIPKYYLDVKVVDKDGKPVSGANLTVTNEVDNTNYPAENITEIQPVFDPKPSSANQYFYLSYQLIQGLTMSTTTTGVDGHTPLPTNKKQTLVIADYVKDSTSTTNFTYTITPSKDGKTATLTGLDINETWYREDPNTPTRTVVCNIDTGSCYVEGVSTGILSGTVKDTSNNPIQGANVSDGTRSTTTNAAGSYALTNVPAGTYTVTASKTGYQSASQSGVVVNQGATTTVDFILTPTTPITGDINQDGAIDISDLRIVALHFGETTTFPYPRYDVDANGTVDILDIMQVAGGM